MAERRLDIIVNAKDRVAAGLRSIQQRLSSFAKKVAQIGVVAAAAASAAIIEMGRRGAQAVDELAKLARQTGENINTLNALRGAADRMGVGASTVTSSIQAMQKRLGEAARGTGQARESLEELGIEVQDIIDLPISEQLALIAERMATIDNENRKAAIASGLFSRAGQSMVLMLQGGSEALSENIDRVSRFRAELDQIGAEGVERANDAITDLKDSIASLGQLIAIRMAPQIERFATELATRMADAADRMAVIFTEPFRGLLTLINRVFDLGATRGEGMASRIMDAMEMVSRRIGEFLATIPERFRIVSLHIQDAMLELKQMLFETIQSLPAGVRSRLGVDDLEVGRTLGEARERRRVISTEALPAARQALDQRTMEFREAFLDRIMDDVAKQAQRIFELPGEAAQRSIEQQEQLISAIERRAQSLESRAREEERLGREEAEQTRRNAEINREKLEEERETLARMRERADALRGVVGQIPDLAERVRRMFGFGGEADAPREAQRRSASAQAPSLETGRLIAGVGAARSDIDRQQLDEQRKQRGLMERSRDLLRDIRETLRDIADDADGGFEGRIGGLLGR